MIPVRVQDVERVGDGGRPRELSGMGDGQQAGVCRNRERVDEGRRRVGGFIAIEAEADDTCDGPDVARRARRSASLGPRLRFWASQ